MGDRAYQRLLQIRLEDLDRRRAVRLFALLCDAAHDRQDLAGIEQYGCLVVLPAVRLAVGVAGDHGRGVVGCVWAGVDRPVAGDELAEHGQEGVVDRLLARGPKSLPRPVANLNWREPPRC